MFPRRRLRRLRRGKILGMVRETSLEVSDLIFPIFVDERIRWREEIKSMPHQFRIPLEEVEKEIGELIDLGIPAVILFGISSYKDEIGSAAYDKNGVIQRAVAAIKSSFGDEIFIITDVCLCGYTEHGHCGILKGGEVRNDETLEILAKVAVSHAEAGADCVAPSAMMDGMVATIRDALDGEGFENTLIMSYAAKYASSFYGPFREAVKSSFKGIRSSYQMDIGNVEEALREVELDIKEGADIVMVKPAIGYLDVLYRVKEKYGFPTAAYNVSGEYSMVMAAASEGWLDKDKVMMEMLTCIKRAGADMIITYFAKDAAKILKAR
ncbi:MAG: porphobilinogen synthase [Candidatus Methanospirareceae archaeon]